METRNIFYPADNSRDVLESSVVFYPVAHSRYLGVDCRELRTDTSNSPRVHTVQTLCTHSTTFITLKYIGRAVKYITTIAFNKSQGTEVQSTVSGITATIEIGRKPNYICFC
jgi:hypothetical protein